MGNHWHNQMSVTDAQSVLGAWLGLTQIKAITGSAVATQKDAELP